MIRGISLFLLFYVSCGEYNIISNTEELHDNISSSVSSLRDILERAFSSNRANSNNEPYFVQLEQKAYYSDGITIKDKDVIIAGS